MTDPKLTAAIDTAAESARRSIEAYADLANQAAAELSGDKRLDTNRWLDLTVKGYGQALRDAGTAWRVYNQLLEALADSGKR